MHNFASFLPKNFPEPPQPARGQEDSDTVVPVSLKEESWGLSARLGFPRIQFVVLELRLIGLREGLASLCRVDVLQLFHL